MQPPGQRCAVLGGIHALRLDELGVEALIVDGNVRDLENMASRSMPVSAAPLQDRIVNTWGLCSILCCVLSIITALHVLLMTSPFTLASKSTPTSTSLDTTLTQRQIWSKGVSCVSAAAECQVRALQVPVDVCGIRVEPDDIMFIDEGAGIVRIPKNLVHEVLNWLENKGKSDEKIMDMIRMGSTIEEAFDKYRPPRPQ